MSTPISKPLSYIVVCRDDTDAEGNPGPFALATRTVFAKMADAVFYAATRPAHVQIAELIIMPTAQASTTLVHRTLPL